MLCANCGADRPGPYCGQCGQNNRDYQRALPPLLGDLLKETFEVDSRLWRTLRLLLIAPGELALEFSRNRRASYVSPIRLYLFVSISFFFMVSLDAGIAPLSDVQPEVSAEIDAVGDTDTLPLLTQLGAEHQPKAEEILARDESSIARLVLLEMAEAVQERAGEPLSILEIYFLRRLVDTLYEPGSMVGQLVDNLAIGMFVLLPVYAALLKLFYFNRHRYYVELLIFSTHLHTFMFIVFTADMLISFKTGLDWLNSGLELLGTALLLWLAVYHYLALRRYFGGGRASTLAKLAGLMVLYTLLLLPTALLMVLLVTVVTV